jgi:glycyl-tRNA synthetase beta chain
MSELFLELFSEEMPSGLQKHAREGIQKLFTESFDKLNINFKSNKSYSTPKRLVFFFEEITEKIEKKGITIKGPKVDSPKSALEGFIKSNNLDRTEVFEQSLDKGRFFFAKINPKIILVKKELAKIIPDILNKYSWKKSMRWADHSLIWGRPLKSILALFDNQVIQFSFHHLVSNNLTFSDEIMEEGQKKIKDFRSYLKLLDSKKIILDQNLRKQLIVKQIDKVCKVRKLKKKLNEKLLDEVVDLVEKPNILVGKFDKSFLNIPKEILITSMQQHQKYFPLFNQEDNLTNFFIIVTNLEDKKGLVKIGNERVISARLSDAKFFWEKNKAQSLVKQVGNLKSINFFSKLGTLFHKVQRMKKLGAMIADQLNLNKVKVEISASICKVDLLSDLVGEYPELQGILGSYFARVQGFDEDISLSIKEHYLPLGLDSKIPKKPISVAVSIVDRIDTLVGFFGIGEKPTSSKDPFALRRTAFGLLRIIIENNLSIQLKNLINYSNTLYLEQGFKFPNQPTLNTITNFLRDRFKNYLKEKKISYDIIEAALASSHVSDDFVSLHKKCLIFNKYLKKDLGKNILTTYKRASNILNQEKKTINLKITGEPNSILFNKDEEKLLFNQINEVRKYFSSVIKNENYEKTLEVLSSAKKTTDNFFENVVVNDENENVKKNRLELLEMFCNTFDNFIDFSKVEGA